MNAVPEKPESDKSKQPGVSRRQKLKDDRKNETYEPDMPPVSCGHYLLDHFFTVGPTLAGAMGDGPLTHEELGWYQANTGVTLSEWEAATLHRLSRDYWHESQKATKRNCPAPWQTEERQQVDKIAVAENLEASILDMMDL